MFGKKTAKVWWIPLSTPLDGDLRVSATVPHGATSEVALVGADRQRGAPSRAVGRPAGQAPRRLGLRPALALRARDAEGRVGARPGLRDGAVTRCVAALVAAALVGAGAVSASDAANARVPMASGARAWPTRSPPSPAQGGHGLVRRRCISPTACRTSWPGNPVHWVYLIPSDGADNLATVASVMQADAERSTRGGGVRIRRAFRGTTSRRSRAARSSTSRRCARRARAPSSRLSTAASRRSWTRWSRPGSAPRSRSTSSTTTVPSRTTTSAGRAAGNSSGFGVAVVYYRSCAGVSTAAVAAHEFLHTIGAVPSGAPNECPGDDSGHTCDDESDLMYPAIGGEPLVGEGARSRTQRLLRALGRLAGHARTRAWLVRLDSQAPLAVTVSGAGSVSSDVPGLQCTASCTTTWNAGQRLALTATPGTGSKLVRWTGACTGSGGCLVDLGTGASVSALFAPATLPADRRGRPDAARCEARARASPAGRAARRRSPRSRRCG